MKEIINKVLSNKKNVIISSVVCLAILVVVLILILSGNKETQQEKLTNQLKELGIDFYENFYYNQISSNDEERIEFLEKYTDIGIKISLDNLARYKTDEREIIIEEFVNDETEEECDRTNSMVVIYPKSPYEKESYSIDAILDCGYIVVEEK